MATAIPFLLQILGVFSAERETIKKKDRGTVNQIIQENNKNPRRQEESALKKDK